MWRSWQTSAVVARPGRPPVGLEGAAALVWPVLGTEPVGAEVVVGRVAERWPDVGTAEVGLAVAALEALVSEGLAERSTWPGAGTEVVAPSGG